MIDARLVKSKSVEYYYEEDSKGVVECHVYAIGLHFTYVEPALEGSDSPEFWATGDHHVFNYPKQN